MHMGLFGDLGFAYKDTVCVKIEKDLVNTYNQDERNANCLKSTQTTSPRYRAVLSLVEVMHGGEALPRGSPGLSGEPVGRGGEGLVSQQRQRRTGHTHAQKRSFSQTGYFPICPPWWGRNSVINENICKKRDMT